MTETEEQVLSKYCALLAEWGVPLTLLDLRLITKGYLDRTNRKVPQFKNNLPGKEWARNFISRQSDELKEKFAMNIRKSRADISRTTVDNFFDNVSEEVTSVPAPNIFNYDETNLSDDPGKKKVISKRSCRRTERVINSSKSCISLMFCGSASGHVLPPYTVYKATHLYDNWVLGGPKNSRFHRSASGWFDLETFEDWFENHFLVHTRNIPGKKILIGDNVSSHISVRVVQLCQENDIKLIFLPPNSTHLLQPLDVAFFGPMKKAWRDILENWKSTSRGSKATGLDKSQFPRLLKNLMEKIGFSSSQNIISGFRATGIFPLDRHKVLEKLPIEDLAAVEEGISGEIIDHLKALRYTDQSSRKPRKRRLQVAPGKSISVEDVEKNTVAGPSNSKKRKTKEVQSDSDGGNSDVEEEQEGDEVEIEKATLSAKDLKKGDHVVVIYEGEYFPGKIVSAKRKRNEFDVLTMTKTLKNWKWSENQKTDTYNLKDIVRKISEPKAVNKRGLYRVKEIETLWGK